MSKIIAVSKGLLFVLFFIVAASVLSGTALAMPVPDSANYYENAPVDSPVKSAIAAEAKPVGVGTVAEGGDTLSILVGLEQFGGPVDVYFAIFAPALDPNNIYLLRSDNGIQTISQGLAPWRAGTTGPIEEAIFGDIPVSGLPPGTYQLYLAVTPAGSLDHYYGWVTSFIAAGPFLSGGMVSVSGGCFQMGDTFGVGYGEELPVHEVCLSSFSIDRYEVTQTEYLTVMGTNPSYFTTCGGNCPVEQVTWTQADVYCKSVDKRLPTEAEWEYSARSGGQNQKYAGTSDDADIVNYAWYDANSVGTHPVGRKLPNGLGLYDMSGNVYEWVADWYDAYSGNFQNNPQGPSAGTGRVNRGGSWGGYSHYLRTSNRGWGYPEGRNLGLGFRCARTN
ncbi:MAG: SUMF1/EgtB/PvdO family nonheme iron enzyme [Nitrospirae bacterium]|nr:SUMF1/EgtB/PvdO family nonheme iron enzyme [Nitrospirota bacterium]